MCAFYNLHYTLSIKKHETLAFKPYLPQYVGVQVMPQYVGLLIRVVQTVSHVPGFRGPHRTQVVHYQRLTVRELLG